MAPKIEFLYWEGCPSWQRALAMLEHELERAGLSRDAVEVRRIDGEDQAQRERFVGSPTIRLDGKDLQPPTGDDPHGLTCRVYHRRDGTVSPLPDRDDLRDALKKLSEKGA